MSSQRNQNILHDKFMVIKKREREREQYAASANGLNVLSHICTTYV